MSLREELIEDFYNEYGYLPDEHDIEAYLNNHTSMLENHFSHYKTTPNNNNPESELIEEVKEIASSVSNVATNTVRNRESTLKPDDNFEELKHMFLLFTAKASLYFIIKSCYNKGYDFTNI